MEGEGFWAGVGSGRGGRSGWSMSDAEKSVIGTEMRIDHVLAEEISFPE
jgi:hypothetical protein